MQSRFEIKKRQILAQLDTPDKLYKDLSPKGSVDKPIRPLIADINKIDSLVTTSSCSGRISVFLEGKKKGVDSTTPELNELQGRNAGPGGKGGGEWLYISHAPIDLSPSAAKNYFTELFKLQRQKSDVHVASTSPSYIHLKFEPMILHILTNTLGDSHRVLTAALSSGFRESGAVSLSASKTGEINPMVAVRSTGYSFDSIIGLQDENNANVALVDESYLLTLIHIANERFKINEERIARFRDALQQQFTYLTTTSHSMNPGRPGWEDAEARRERKRTEGLARQRQVQQEKSSVAPAAIPDDTIRHGDFLNAI